MGIVIDAITNLAYYIQQATGMNTHSEHNVPISPKLADETVPISISSPNSINAPAPKMIRMSNPVVNSITKHNTLKQSYTNCNYFTGKPINNVKITNKSHPQTCKFQILK